MGRSFPSAHRLLVYATGQETHRRVHASARVQNCGRLPASPPGALRRSRGARSVGGRDAPVCG
eukprot:349822-Chlamydomonas_euryale.AAC.1